MIKIIPVLWDFQGFPRSLKFPRLPTLSKVFSYQVFKSFECRQSRKKIKSFRIRLKLEYASLLHNCSPTRRGFPFELPSCSLSGRISLDKSTSLHNLVKFCATRSTRVERQRGREREKEREWMAIGENGVGARGTGTTSELNPIRSTWLCGFASLPQIESPAGYYVSMFTIWRPAIPPLCA